MYESKTQIQTASPWEFQSSLTLPRLQALHDLMLPPSIAIKQQLRGFLHRQRHLQGAQILSWLWDNPGENFPAEKLSDMLFNIRIPRTDLKKHTGASKHLLLEQTIPYCDSQTLSQVRHRVQQLQLKLADPALTEAQSQAANTELASLLAYLRDCVAPGGNIRHFRATAVKPIKRLRSAIERLLACAKAEDPALEHYVREHLSCGKFFSWKDKSV